MPKQIHLALDVSWTQVESAWRLPGSWVGRHYPDVGLFEDIVRIAERGLDKAGMPVGLQLIAPAWAEERLLAIALAAERVLGTATERLGIPTLLA